MKTSKERFCQEYVKLGNATQAAINAGYSKKTASQIGSHLLKEPEIGEKIEELIEEAAGDGDASPAGVIQMLLSTYESATKDRQHGPAARCAELLGKRHSMFTDRVEQSTDKMEPDELIDVLCEDVGPLMRVLLTRLINGKATEDNDIREAVLGYGKSVA